MKYLALATLFFLALSAEAQYVEYGEAAWYSDALHGKKTASGEVYDKTKLTAAHRTLPTGSIIKITRTDNNLTVRVRVNDCGPHKAGRIVDLSRAAADKIGLVRDGVANVKVELIQRGEGQSPCDKVVAGTPASYSENAEGLTARGVGQVSPASPYITPPAGVTVPFELLRPITSGYGVQVASFGKFENATAKAEELQAKGFKDILINSANLTYRVILGPFPTEAAAETYRANLQKNYKIKGFSLELAGLR